MTDGLHGHGTVLDVNDGTNTTTCGNVISITGPDETRDPIDVSSMDSTNKARDFIPGMRDAGEVTFDLNYLGAATNTPKLLHDLKTSTAMTWTVALNDAGTTTVKSSLACSGFITSLGHAIPYDDKVTQSVTVKFTGEPTYTPHG